MPSTTSSSVARPLASSTVITPSLPTFCMASEIIWPMLASPLAEMVPTWATSDSVETVRERFLMSATTASTAKVIPRLRSIGFMPAVTALAPSRTIAWASTVAVVVPSPASSEVLDATSRSICAPMFSNLSKSSISLATVTPSLEMRGAPNDLSMITLRPLGPSVTLTASASISMPRSMRARASVLNLMSLAAMAVRPPHTWLAFWRSSGSRRLACRALAFDDAYDVRFLHDQQLLAVHLDLGARPFAEQDGIAFLDIRLNPLAGLVAGARADRHHLALHRLFLGGIGDDHSTRRARLLLDPPDHHTIMQRLDFHDSSSYSTAKTAVERPRRKTCDVLCFAG